MYAEETDEMFNFRFEKTSSEIKEKAKVKIEALNAKIEERQGRLAELRREYGIDDAALVQLHENRAVGHDLHAFVTAARRQAQERSYAYTSNAVVQGKTRMEEKTIGAGVVNNLLTENDFVEADKANVKRLETMFRNLRPLQRLHPVTGNAITEDNFTLSYEELTYLGF